MTVPDVVTTYAGNAVFPAVLKNDSDAEGDRLTVCGLGEREVPPHQERLREEVALPGDQVPGEARNLHLHLPRVRRHRADARHLNLVLAKPPKIQVRAVPAAHGRVRATSKAPFRVELTFGNFSKDDPEGKVIIPTRGSLVFSSRYHHVPLDRAHRGGTFLTQGHLRYVP